MLIRFISVLIVLASSSAFGWGAIGHQIIAYTGANSATEGKVFWSKNIESMRTLSTVPDRLWKTPALKPHEGLTHWFQVDAYYKPVDFGNIISFPSAYSQAISRYSESNVLINGTAPWRIRQLYQLAFQALKLGSAEKALQYVGVMSHYIGDLSQPLHVTENHNGQLSGNLGIHSYFETSVIIDEIAIRADVQKRTAILLKDGKYLSQFNGSLMDVILFSVERSVKQLETVLSNDKKYGRNVNGAAIQLELAKDRLADGSATFAMILNQLWKETGRNDLASTVKVDEPQWIKPDYSNLTF